MLKEKYTIAYKRLNNELEPISKKYGKSKVYFLIDAAYCYLRHGASPRDYVNFEFYKLKNLERKRFLTMKKTHRVEEIYNDQSCGKYFNNKYLFNKRFEQFIKRDWVYMPETNLEQFIEFLEGKDRILVKPLGSSSGKGIYAIDTRQFDKHERIYEELKGNDFLIEEFIMQHEAFNELNRETVNTVRIYTLINERGVPEIIFSALRVGGSKTVVDNFHSGGVGYPLDIKNGVVYKPGSDIKGVYHTVHPSSGKSMIGFQVPNWEQLKQFVLKAAEEFPQSRYIAWDVAVLEDGFEFVEGNYKGDAGFLQAVDKVGKVSYFKELK